MYWHAIVCTHTIPSPVWGSARNLRYPIQEPRVGDTKGNTCFFRRGLRRGLRRGCKEATRHLFLSCRLLAQAERRRVEQRERERERENRG